MACVLLRFPRVLVPPSCPRLRTLTHTVYVRTRTHNQVPAAVVTVFVQLPDASQAPLPAHLQQQATAANQTMMYHHPNDDKENADPSQHGKGFLGRSSNSRPLSPGKRKRTPEEKEARPPLRDITGLPGITPTFVVEPPAFAIATDAEAATSSSSSSSSSTTQQPGDAGNRKKKPAAAAGGSSSAGGKQPNKKQPPGAGGAGAGGSTLSGPPMRPLR